jgi:hypothetical protein
LEKKQLELMHARKKLDEAGERKSPPLRNPRTTSTGSVKKQEVSDVSLGLVVEFPAKFDVICALGEAYSIQHSGNRRFQVLIEENFHRYELLCSSSLGATHGCMFTMKDTEKAMLLFGEMLILIKKFGGRFITRNNSGQWKLASDSFALRKIEATFISYGDTKAIMNTNAYISH